MAVVSIYKYDTNLVKTFIEPQLLLLLKSRSGHVSGGLTSSLYLIRFNKLSLVFSDYICSVFPKDAYFGIFNRSSDRYMIHLYCLFLCILYAWPFEPHLIEY